MTELKPCPFCGSNLLEILKTRQFIMLDDSYGCHVLFVTIRKDGVSSMKVTVTELAAAVGAKVGDQVRITMTVIEEPEE